MTNFSIRLDTPYGEFIMDRHDIHQPAAIVRTGRPHIADEIDALLALVDHFSPGAVVLDIGANIGLIGIPIARKLSSRNGTVIAFEPQRVIFYMLAGNVVLNGLQNVFCHQMAVSDQLGTLAIPDINYESPNDFGMVCLRPPGDGYNGGEEVRAITIDSLNLERVDLIKVDVESMELQVLTGARQTIDRHRPLMWLEAWPAQRRGVFDWLTDHRYAMFIADELNFLCIAEEHLTGRYDVSLTRFDGLNSSHNP